MLVSGYIRLKCFFFETYQDNSDSVVKMDGNWPEKWQKRRCFEAFSTEAWLLEEGLPFFCARCFNKLGKHVVYLGVYHPKWWILSIGISWVCPFSGMQPWQHEGLDRKLLNMGPDPRYIDTLNKSIFCDVLCQILPTECTYFPNKDPGSWITD